MKKFVLSAFESVKSNWKQSLLLPAIFIFAAVLIRVLVLSDNTHPVQFQKAIEHPGFETTPAYYQVYVSPSQAWDETHDTTGAKVLSVVANVFFWAAILLMIFSAVDLIYFKNPMLPIILCLLAWAVLRYTHYSNSLGYYVRSSEQEFKKAKEDPKGLDVLFYGKDLY